MGKFVADMANGKGTCYYPAGDVFEGTFRNGEREGKVSKGVGKGQEQGIDHDPKRSHRGLHCCYIPLC